MNDDREMERHKKIIEQIKDASKKEDLPNITSASISSYLANNVYFGDVHISQSLFKPVVDVIIEYNLFSMPQVRDVFINVLKENYPNRNENDYLEKYIMISKSPRIMNLLVEISERNVKLKQFQDKEDLDNHNAIMKNIDSCYEVLLLPKIGIGDLNRRILRGFNSNDFIKNIKVGNIRNITDAYMDGKSFKEIDGLIYDFCDKQSLDKDNRKLMYIQIRSQLLSDKNIKYLVDEIKAKDKRKYKIYKMDHEQTMEHIKNATRISQLPPNLTVSVLTSYLSSNSVIYSKGDRVSTVDLKELTKLLLDGKKWDSDAIKREVYNISSKYYKDKVDISYKLFMDKFKGLAKTFYLIDEINASNERVLEFTRNRNSNVNIYFIPNSKGPNTGGRFYNCYINRVDNLDLSNIFQSYMEDNETPCMDIDSIEWFMREYYDNSFKAVGGIILNHDETIGNVNIFSPNDGNVTISKDDALGYDELKVLLASANDIIKKKSKLQEHFLKVQEEFLSNQKRIDEQLSELEEKIDILTNKFNKDSYSRKKEK